MGKGSQSVALFMAMALLLGASPPRGDKERPIEKDPRPYLKWLSTNYREHLPARRFIASWDGDWAFEGGAGKTQVYNFLVRVFVNREVPTSDVVTIWPITDSSTDLYLRSNLVVVSDGATGFRIVSEHTH